MTDLVENAGATASGAAAFDPYLLPPELRRAIEACILGGNNFRPQLEATHPPAAASLADGLAHYGLGPAPDHAPAAEFHRWAAWRGIEQLRLVWEALSRPGPSSERGVS